MNQKMVDKLEQITKDMRGATDGMEEYLAIAKEMVSVSDKLDSKSPVRFPGGENIELEPHDPKDLTTAKSVSRYLNQPDESEPEQAPVHETEEQEDPFKLPPMPEQVQTEDGTALLSKLREWEGLHEVNDKKTLMGHFRQAGFEFNPVTEPWCGAGLRAALVLSGYKDPGLAGHKASNYANYGTPCERQTGSIWFGHAHCAVVTESDQIIGCNQSDMVCEQPESYYGIALGFVMPVV